MGELFVISASYLFATLIDNRLVLWRQKKRERITPLYHRDQHASDLLKYTTKLLISLLIIKRRKKYSRSIFTIFARHLFTEEGNFDARYFQIITGERFKLTKSSSRVKNVLFPLCPSLLCEKEKEIERKNKTSTPLPPSFAIRIHPIHIRMERKRNSFRSIEWKHRLDITSFTSNLYPTHFPLFELIVESTPSYTRTYETCCTYAHPYNRERNRDRIFPSPTVFDDKPALISCYPRLFPIERVSKERYLPSLLFSPRKNSRKGEAKVESWPAHSRKWSRKATRSRALDGLVRSKDVQRTFKRWDVEETSRRRGTVSSGNIYSCTSCKSQKFFLVRLFPFFLANIDTCVKRSWTFTHVDPQLITFP